MCTAIYENKSRPLFGRTLDLEYSYGESVVVTPHRFPLRFLHEAENSAHLAIVGTAHIGDGYPLYYDAVNESGLAAAGLNFPDNAVYSPKREGFFNLASFELIPWLLSRCENLTDALRLLRRTNITPDAFSHDLPPTPLHWLIADRERAVTLEATSRGVQIYDNPVGVLTNNPPFDYHLTNLANFMSADSLPPKNTLCPSLQIKPYSRGMGGLGLPGDFSSTSRFVRAVFAKTHTAYAESESADIGRFFHIMDTVAQPRGCALTEEGAPICTVYTSCADLRSAEYYFTTYSCRQIRAVSLSELSLNTENLISYPMEQSENISYLCRMGD
ncbi:MAG: choloylglycine hydrolase [Clostridia bacterium]|nr:choloylglycine hydrolase [Clostridia bacterium]